MTTTGVDSTGNCCVSLCFQMFLTVYLSNNEQHFTEVPVTPETVCRDVVDLCKEPGESDCHLAEVWCGSGGGPRQPGAGVSASSLPSVVSRGGMRPSRLSPEGLWDRIACPSGDSGLDPASLQHIKSICCFLFLQHSKSPGQERSEAGQLIHRLRCRGKVRGAQRYFSYA